MLHQFIRVGGVSSILLVVVIVGAAHAGTVTGQIRYTGPVAPMTPVKVTRDDEFCGETWSDHPVRVDPQSKGLFGVVVSIDGLPIPSTLETHAELIVSNTDCRFAPRVGAVQAGQFLHIRNTDPLLHNTHIFQGKRTLLNVALVPGGRDIKKRIKWPGRLLIKCDKHTFMRGRIAVFDHPYFAVTDHQGMFRISGLPPGTHRVTMWHETLGSRTAHATVSQEGEVSLALDFATKP